MSTHLKAYLVYNSKYQARIFFIIGSYDIIGSIKNLK